MRVCDYTCTSQHRGGANVVYAGSCGRLMLSCSCVDKRLKVGSSGVAGSPRPAFHTPVAMCRDLSGGEEQQSNNKLSGALPPEWGAMGALQSL